MKRNNLKPVGKMTPEELRDELRKSRRTITRWVRAYNKGGNERCHELDQELARLVGLDLYPDRKNGPMLASVFFGNCAAYIGRECRQGKLVDDRKENKKK